MMETDDRMSTLSTYDGQSIYHSIATERPSCMYSVSPNSSPNTPETKFYKVMKENSREMFCKRRLNFNHTDYLGHKPPTVAVARRNERERNRVKLINMTFATLREHIPSPGKGGKSKKMSKVDTLKAAIDYIRYLQDLVDEHDAVNAVLDNNCLPRSVISPSSSSVVHSPSPSTCSDTSQEIVSTEEEDLLDFANWF